MRWSKSLDLAKLDPGRGSESRCRRALHPRRCNARNASGRWPTPLKGKDAIIINYGAPDERLARGGLPPQRPATPLPARAMLADALAQYLVWKKWNTLAARTQGPRDEDKLYADAIRRAAKRFGGKIVEERPFTYETGTSRRSDGGYEQIQQQIPNLHPKRTRVRRADRRRRSQRVRRLLPLSHLGRASRCRHLGPRCGELVYAIELWGGTQFQKRLKRLADRYLRPEDYNAWLAARMVGEAASRTKSNGFKELFDVYAFSSVRGRRLQGRRTFRAQLERTGPPADAR